MLQYLIVGLFAAEIYRLSQLPDAGLYQAPANSQQGNVDQKSTATAVAPTETVQT